MNERNLPTWPGWETVRLIGRGSFGAVYEIERDVYGHKEKAAMKVITIPQNESDVEDLYDSGYDEASVTATFQSHLEKIVNEYSLMREMNGAANVVNCDDIRVVEHDDSVGWDIYIRMELLTPLAKAVDKQPSDETVIQIASDICKALILCRKHDIIHRDIKPQNIFVSKNGDYKLGDFGIAKTMEKTSGGTKIGTYKYMAPEVYNNQGYNLTADIYSLGLVLYWLLNERRTPFLPLPPVTPTSTEEDSARTRRFKGEAIPAPAHGSKELQRIIRKTCAYDPKDRYQSAEEMLHALERLRDPTASATPETEKDEEDLTVGGFHDTSANSGTSEKDKQAADKDDSATVSAFGDKTSHHGDEKDGTSTPQKPLAPASWLVVCLIVLAGLMSVLAFKSCDNGTAASVQTSAPTVRPASTTTATAVPTTKPTPVPTAKPTATPTPTAVPTSTKTPSKDDIVALGENVVHPQNSSYLSEYETMYVKSEKGHSIYVYFAPKVSEDNRRSYFAYEGDQVTVLARENGFSCVLFPDSYGNMHVGWVNSKHLVYVY